ncbi:hypothetical protein DMN91_002503 [Ooceraea biroi]|uniref:F-box domain-containing protein n=1 Tax=Ooceraea biroi TaxID=2015173 RepID=A0A3L8DVE9_OOCBI|nr:hypothetical protein DMN91_002503 [Ooceraea biroi]
MISDLPVELITIILRNDGISIQDSVNFSSTCKHFHEMLKENNTLWRRIFYQRWPRLKIVYEKEIRKGYVDFRELIKERVQCGKTLRPFLSQMSRKYYYQNCTCQYRLETFIDGPLKRCRCYNNVNWEDFYSLINPNDLTHPLNCTLLMDELTSILEQPLSAYRDLTNIYYGEQLLPHFKHYHLTNVWQEFRNRPAEQQVLEEVLAIVAQWFQPERNICYSHIQTELDNIAEEALIHLRKQNPLHPIFAESHEQFSLWKHENIEENQWNDSNGREILNILYKIFVTELNIHGIASPKYRLSSQVYLLLIYIFGEKMSNHVISLTIVFQGVARRLGIRCDLVPCKTYFAHYLGLDEPDHCYLSWKPKCNVTNPDEKERFYIDISDNDILSTNDYPTITPPSNTKRCLSTEFETFYSSINLILELAMSTAVQTRFNSSLIGRCKSRHYVELDDLLTPYNIHDLGVQSSDCDKKNIKEYVGIPREPKMREVGMKFAVGMIVTIHPEHEAGVIIAWKKDRTSNRESKHLPRLYTLLCKNERMCCVYEGTNIDCIV